MIYLPRLLNTYLKGDAVATSDATVSVEER